MTSAAVAGQIACLIAAYDPRAPAPCANGFRRIWLQFEPGSMAAIKAEQRERQETVGVPVSVLRSIGKEVAKTASARVLDFLPLAQLLWDSYGREGRVVALAVLGAMELVAPDTVVPLLREMARSCITWEDADRLAMDALEPIVRSKPEQWLAPIVPWLADESEWVRRACVTVIGRLPMKHPTYTARCLRLIERVLLDKDIDVRKAVSFAIRLAARGDAAPVCEFLQRHIPPDDPAATWVLCDAIRSMARKLLPEFASLLRQYQAWAANLNLSARDRRSVESAIKVLRRAQP